jgi:hypothetical protein
MKYKAPSDRGEFKPIEIPSVTFEVKTSLRKPGEEVTVPCPNHGIQMVRSKKKITTSRERSHL